jgi:xylan 1,4-beta-xylosidase
VRKALPTARVGGPELTMGGTDYLREFFEHALRGRNEATGGVGGPLNFLSVHAKGKPEFLVEKGCVRMGVANHLREIDSAFEIIARFPELKAKPIVIGESDPEGAVAAA